MRKKSKGKKLKLYSVILFLVLIVSALVVVVDYKIKENKSIDSAEDTTFAETEEDLTLTEEKEILYQSDEIEIYTLFPSSAMNPDAEMQFGENVATVEYKNISNLYLKKCEIQIISLTGETYTFLLEDIPAGVEGIAFDTSNKVLEDDAKCENISCVTEMMEEDTFLKDQIEISVTGTEISLTNIGEDDVANLLVTCHCALDQTVYGGAKYEYPVEFIASGETITVNAEECYIGEAKVVQLTTE